MTAPDLERVRFITRHFNDLQGLKLGVPLGLITLACAGPALLRAAGFLLALAVILAARAHYRAAFGQVERQPLDLAVISIYSPAGSVSRLNGWPLMTPIVRHFLLVVTAVVVLFTYFQALPPNFVVDGDAALGQHPQILPESAPYYGPPVIIESYPHGGAMRPPSMLRAVVAQTLYALYGSLLLGLWLWRRCHRTQAHQLTLSVLLLGLSALGTSLGFLARTGAEIGGLTDLVLPALVYPSVALPLCGAAMLLAGLLDHRQLVQTLGRREEA